jgi:hypothetical protein
LTEDQENPEQIALQNMLTSIFQDQKVLKYDWVNIDFLSNKFAGTDSALDFFENLLGHLGEI